MLRYYNYQVSFLKDRNWNFFKYISLKLFTRNVANDELVFNYNYNNHYEIQSHFREKLWHFDNAI